MILIRRSRTLEITMDSMLPMPFANAGVVMDFLKDHEVSR